MTKDQAKSIADKINSRNIIDIIDVEIASCAEKGLYSYTSSYMNSENASNLKEYFKIKGFNVEKRKGPYANDNSYYLTISWK